MKLFDAHCHLQDSRLRKNLAGVLQRARAVGLEGMLCCGSAEDDWEDVAVIAAESSMVVPAFGLHPWYVQKRSACWEDRLRAFLHRFPFAAVGEIGLDHALPGRNDEEQRIVFLAQLALARELRRPVAIHCRRAWSDLLSMQAELAALPAGFLVHSYSGSVNMIETLTRLGGWFSFSGSITWPRNLRGQSAVRQVPEERLLIETDAPDLRPWLSGSADSPADEPNEPANLSLILRRVAELRGMPPEAMAERLWSNTLEFLGPDVVSEKRPV